MVKADAKRNYYADLELTPAADTEEIKKQFRKLARLYHPDRNPGKEVEYVPKFQAIQAAHEILSDPDTRAKYDADRRKLGPGTGGSRPPPGAPRHGQGQTNFNRSPYEAWSNFPPPRMRTQANAPRERPQSYAAHSSQGPPRPANFANYAPPRNPPPRPPPRQTYAQDDADVRRNVFTAWEQMKHKQHPQEQTFSDDDGLRKARAQKDAAAAHQSKPGLGRSNTTRMPRKGGFDPNARLSGDWEPAARTTSSYNATPRRTPPSAPSPPPPTAHGEKPKLRPEPLGAFRTKMSPDDVPYSEGTTRIRTPYASEGIGQKTYFNPESLSRSSSMRDAPELARRATAKGLSPRANAARHRSASPVGRNANAKPDVRRASVAPGARKGTKFNLGYDSSSSEVSSADEGDAGSDTSTKPMSGTVNGGSTSKTRKTAKPSGFWQGRTDSPRRDQTNGAQTAPGSPPGTGAAGTQPTYGNFPFIPSSTSATDQQEQLRAFHNVTRIPLYARRQASSGFTPINVLSGNSSRFGFSPASGEQGTASETQENDEHNNAQFTRMRPHLRFPEYTLPPQQLANQRAHRFSFSNVESGGNSQPRSNSADDVNVNFNPNKWEGSFQGNNNPFVPPPPPPTSGRGTTRRRGSPTRRATATRQTRNGTSMDNPIDLTSNQPGAQNNPIEVDSFKVPPPPPFPPKSAGARPDSAGVPPSSAGSSQGGVPLTGQTAGTGTFKSEEWEWLKKPTLFVAQPGEARPPSPGKSTPATVKKGKAPRPRQQSKSENKLNPQPSGVSSDAEGEESEVPTRSPPGAVSDGDAMDIDSDLPNGTNKNTSPRTRREPRMVPVQPQRPEWRDAKTQPGVVPGLKGNIPSAVPNAAVPPPPPPPPPPSSNTKQKRDASLNFESFRTAAPFAPSAGGFSSLKSDLAGTLPFESQPSSSHPDKPFQPRQLELPMPPKAPNPPSDMRIPQSKWREYMSAMAFYMGAWYQFEEKMLAHFNTRHQNAQKFGTGAEGAAGSARDAMRLLESGGEGTEEGYVSYLRGMEEDVRVGKHWDVAKERHRFAIETLLDFKKKVFMGQALLVPDGH